MYINKVNLLTILYINIFQYKKLLNYSHRETEKFLLTKKIKICKMIKYREDIRKNQKNMKNNV